MKNTVIKGDGTSRKIKAPSDMPTTFGDWRAQLLAGSATFDIALNADGCETVGTPLSKANLLSDTTETALELTSEEPTVDEALNKIASSKANKSVKVNTRLTAAGWSSEKEYLYANTRLSATCVIELLPRENNGITLEQFEALAGAMIVGGRQTGGGIYLVALGEVPTIDIPVTVIIREDL